MNTLATLASSTTSNAAGGVFVVVFLVIYLLIFAIAIGAVVFTIICVVDIAKRPDWQFKLAGQEKILWLLLVILVNFLAIPSFIYWYSIRKKLLAVEQAAAAGAYGPGRMGYNGWEPGPMGPTGQFQPAQPATPAQPTIAPASWQPDPTDPHQLRWWDGSAWTEQVRPRHS